MANIAESQTTLPYSSVAGNTTFTGNAFSANLTPGSGLVAFLAGAQDPGFDPSLPVQDSNGQIFTFKAKIVDLPNTSVFWLFTFPNNAYSNTPTVTVKFLGTVTYFNLIVAELINASTTAPSGSAVNASELVAPGTGPNALALPLTTSGTGLVYGINSDISSAGSVVLGAGFAGTKHFTTGVGFGNGLLESKRVTSGTSNPLTWTDATHGGADSYLQMGLFWPELAAGVTSTAKLLTSSNSGGF